MEKFKNTSETANLFILRLNTNLNGILYVNTCQVPPTQLFTLHVSATTKVADTNTSTLSPPTLLQARGLWQMTVSLTSVFIFANVSASAGGERKFFRSPHRESLCKVHTTMLPTYLYTSFFFHICETVHHWYNNINSQLDATVIILLIIKISSCFGR